MGKVMAVDRTREGILLRAKKRSGREGRFPYQLLIPSALVLALVSVYPLYQGIRASMTTYIFGRPAGFAGTKNYVDILHDDTFREALALTAKFVIIVVTLETVLGLGLALLLVSKVKFAKTIRLIILAPMAVAPVVVGIIWRLMYASDVGVVSPIFTALGFDDPLVLARPTSAFIGLVVVDVWEWTPLLFLICLAGLQSLPQEPLEAAMVDGAGPVRVFLQHTLPLLAPVLSVGIILRLIDAIGTFDQIFVLTRGGPGSATQLMSIYAYNTAFSFTQYGHGTAMLVLLTLIVFALMMVAFYLMRRAARISA